MKQKTFLMLKPDAFANHHVEDVLEDLKQAGLCIERQKEVQVDMEVMKTLIEHYAGVIDSMDKDFNFPGKLFNSFYYDGPHYIMPMEVSYDGEEDIITLTRTLAGKTNPQDAEPNSIRGKYSDDSYDKASAGLRLVNNVIHASDSKESAERELKIWKKYL